MRLFSRIFLTLAVQAVVVALAVTVVLVAVVEPGPDARTQGLTGLGAIGALLAVLIVAGFVLARRWSHPQAALFEASRAVAQGNYDLAFDENGAHETRGTMRNLGRIARSFDRLETARRTWLVSVSEELRQPIGALGGQLDDIARRETMRGSAELGELSASVKRLAQLADDLHAVALADLGRLPVSFAMVDPTALIHNAIHANGARAKALRVALEPGVLPQATVLVKWDGVRIEQMFSALIESSLRYTPAGGRITLGLESQRSAWRLVVDDSAPGIDVGLAQRLFEPFYRTTATPGESVTTSGLGLATSQAIVEAHHGRITASRSPLGGLRVTVILPAAPPTA